MSTNIDVNSSQLIEGRSPGNPHALASAHFALVQRAVDEIPLAIFDVIVTSIRAATRGGHRVYIFGNGGSASTAAHIVADLARCAVDGKPVRAYSLADNPAVMTAWANDIRFEDIFAAEVDRHVDAHDIVVAISVSGRSPNVLSALRCARTLGASTIALVGADGGPAAHIADVALVVPSADYGVVEVAHLAVAHALADELRGGSRRVAARGNSGVGNRTP